MSDAGLIIALMKLKRLTIEVRGGQIIECEWLRMGSWLEPVRYDADCVPILTEKTRKLFADKLKAVTEFLDGLEDG